MHVCSLKCDLLTLLQAISLCLLLAACSVFGSLLSHYQHSRMIRKPLCTYYSPEASQLLQEIQSAYLALPARGAASTGRFRRLVQPQTDNNHLLNTSKLLALVVPHGAACDGFYVAAHAYRELNDYCKGARCTQLTAVLIGTEHQGTTPIALSRKAFWATPLGETAVDIAAVDYLSQTHNIPINEAPHSTEHSIENQLPFLQHAAIHKWDLYSAGCTPAAAAPVGERTPPAAAVAAAAGQQAADLTIVPISVGYLGSQPQLIKQYGAAVADLLQHLQQQQRFGNSSSSGSSEVVLIVSSDFTHAGPWYRELPPPGVRLEEYMMTQDSPVLQAVQEGAVDALLTAAAKTHNSMCGLYPLAVALEALYGSSGSSTSLRAAKPELLQYKPAHLIYNRPDSTGFAAFAAWQHQSD